MKFKIGDIEIEADLNIWQIFTVTLLGLFIYYLRNPEKFEKLVTLANKYLKNIFKFAEYNYVKYDIQSSLNTYIKKVTSS